VAPDWLANALHRTTRLHDVAVRPHRSRNPTGDGTGSQAGAVRVSQMRVVSVAPPSGLADQVKEVVATVQLSRNELTVQRRVLTTAPTLGTGALVMDPVECGCETLLTVVRHSIGPEALEKQG
jgi:hypothetical protein